MSESRLHLHFLSLLLICCVSPSYFFTFKPDDSSYVACGPHQTKALTEFMNEFDNSRCNLSDPFNGVWCDNSTGAVTKLQLSDCLSGTLNPNSSLFRLHHLSHLDLNQNNFISSTLPFEFGNLKRLEFLSLYDNSFSGQVPSSFSNLNLLSYLDLSENELSGSFPLVRNLTKLSVLDLSNNHFSGTLNPDSTSLFEFHHLRNIHLGSNNFSSSLPSEFGNLNRLEYLSLSSNEFSGQVPPTISNLTSIKELYLERNQFNGSFPLVQNLTMLSTIDASDNHFSGTIPSYLLTMPSLTYLDLRGNDLTGSIEVDNSSTSSMLKSLYLGNNHFEGKIIEPISNLIKLKELHLSFFSTDYMIDVNLLFSSLKYLVNLDLSGNSISSDSLDTNSEIPTNLKGISLQGCGITKFPNILKNLEKLEFIALGDNRIKGKLPEWLWNLPRLTSVFLSNNSITGFEGPVDVLINSSLKYLQLELNCFEGAIPILPLYINFFAASHNRFSGSIPLSICNCRSLTQLMLDYNNLAGPIPKCLSHNNLTFVNLRKNNLEGSIPDAFCTGASLRSLDVGHNRLTGKLPRSLQNCSSLEFLVADHNKIKDKFPFWLKALPNLQVLILSSNKFYGSISPPGQGPRGFPELRIFEISDNKFTGSLPSRYFVNWKASSMNEAGSLYMHYGKLRSGEVSVMGAETIDLQYKGLLMEQVLVLTSYAAIDFSGNRIEGQIPESIGLLKALIALNLSNNAFTGHIPLSFSNLSNLESLDLSRNQLSGTIPSGLESLWFLSYINVSHNQLKGEIPQGTQITGQPKSSFEGNAGLCGLPLQDTCFGTNVPPTQQPKEEDEEEEVEVLNWKGVVIGYGVGLFLGLTIAHVIASYKPEWLVKIIGPTKRRSR